MIMKFLPFSLESVGILTQTAINIVTKQHREPVNHISTLRSLQ